jgi:hypothetical protein
VGFQLSLWALSLVYLQCGLDNDNRERKYLFVCDRRRQIDLIFYYYLVLFVSSMMIPKTPWPIVDGEEIVQLALRIIHTLATRSEETKTLLSRILYHVCYLGA